MEHWVMNLFTKQWSGQLHLASLAQGVYRKSWRPHEENCIDCNKEVNTETLAKPDFHGLYLEGSFIIPIGFKIYSPVSKQT